MKPDGPARIPIPLPQRWHDVRVRYFPWVLFAGAVVAGGVLWREHAATLGMVGQAEPVVSNVSCHRTGVLLELAVERFQRVRMGDPIGRVMVADPKILAASLAVIQVGS